MSTRRSIQNKPFKYRQDFKNFEETEDYFFIQKLDNVFKQYPHLLKREFFEAPFRIYPEETKFFSLKFYSSSKGLSTCIAYLNILDKKNPKEQLPFIKESLGFIFEFCKKHNLRLCDYTSYRSVAQPDCLKHLKQHQISWYVIFDTPGFLKQVSNMQRDEYEIYFGSDKEYTEYLTVLNNFPDVRTFIQRGLKLLEKHLALASSK